MSKSSRTSEPNAAMRPIAREHVGHVLKMFVDRFPSFERRAGADVETLATIVLRLPPALALTGGVFNLDDFVTAEASAEGADREVARLVIGMFALRLLPIFGDRMVARCVSCDESHLMVEHVGCADGVDVIVRTTRGLHVAAASRKIDPRSSN